MSVAMKYLRISEQECIELYKAYEDKVYFKYMLFNLGIVNRWKRESEELIAELEKLCGKKWVNPYMPEKERFTLTLTDEERSLVEECIKAGYYSTENIEKRREEAHKAKMMKKRAEICERYDKRIRQAEAEKKIMLCVFDYGLSTDNAIYYPHSNTLSFNWNNCENKITQKEFDKIDEKNKNPELTSINTFNDTVKKANEIKDRVLKYVYNIKQERSYNNDMVGIFERYKDIADGDMEVAMNFIKEAYPFNEETEVFIRKKFNMSIPVEPEE